MFEQASYIDITLKKWKEAWPRAKKIWSDYVKLRPPVWCETASDVRNEGIRDSFAMIRLTDHRIVIDIRKIVKNELEDCALQILAHEIGHHIYTPANLKDNALIISSIRRNLVDLGREAPFVANLYEDLLINDRLQRDKGLDMALVYKKINKEIQFTKLWTLYMRTYEYLWKLDRGVLANDLSYHDDVIDADASIMASLIRSYSKNWLEGASRFAAMIYPYLMDEKECESAKKKILILLDTQDAGKEGGVVSGLIEVGVDEIIDPRSEVMGEDSSLNNPLDSFKNKDGGVGPEQRYLGPGTYIDLMRQINPSLEEQELINNYYKEVALPYLIDFPIDENVNELDTLPEGMETWDIGDSFDAVDWIQTSIHSPHIFPGVNTLKRVYGPSGDQENNASPLNVYIGIDCSGSMNNPKVNFSWPVLAATIIALSALRAGSKVMGCLSGEPGSYLQNDGYERNEKDVLTVITSYLGTGYAYGVNRLKDPFGTPSKQKSHIVIVTDDDIFRMLGATHIYNNEEGKATESLEMWRIIEEALENAGGTGTIVLHSLRKWHQEEVERLKKMGWNIHYVTNQEELVSFAEGFSKMNYK